MNGKPYIMKRSAENSRSLPNRDPERRAHQRYGVHKIVSYARGEKRLLTIAVDLGMGGMKINTHETLAKNERLDFRMVLGKDSISSRGRVVYSRALSGAQNVSGIQFLGLNRRDAALLRRYFSALEE